MNLHSRTLTAIGTQHPTKFHETAESSDYQQKQKIECKKYRIGDNIDIINYGTLEKGSNLKWDISQIKGEDYPKQRLNSSGNSKRNHKKNIISPQGMVSLNNI